MLPVARMSLLLRLTFSITVLFLATGNPVLGQGTAGPVISDTKVGYIDSAVPMDVLRFRFDSAFNNQRPTRGEFFWAPGPPFGPGLPLPERRVDYDDVSAYAEMKLLPRLSGFVELPVRFLNPEVNANATGLSDLNAGFKYAMWMQPGQLLTFQFRTYVPSGDVTRGLGNGHVSLEPSLLFMQALNDKTRLEGELRYWVPVGGHDFASEMVRYGLGISHDVYTGCRYRVTPVAEFVGWTLMGGKESVVLPSGKVDIVDASGDTIANMKLGVRVGIGDRVDVYGGWGRPITGPRWYDNIYRVELRFRF